MFILLGAIVLIWGIVLYVNGNNTNSDLDAQMESLFSDGVVNPGEKLETFGIILIVTGIALIIVGLVLNEKKNLQAGQIQPPPTYFVKGVNTPRKFCPNCGKPNPVENKFCPHCGINFEKMQ